MKGTVYVGLSGGVDSSVSTALLKQQGYDVIGVFIKVWQPDFFEPARIGLPGGCTWREDRLDAIRICAKLKIPFKTLNLEKEYKKEVVDYMISEYEAGRTPNPDVMCNRFVKFGGFYDWAIKNGADFVATGHYAQVKITRQGLAHLLEGKDNNKDQSYFLWTLPQEKLKKCLFPVGSLEKPAVRKLAEKFDLVTSVKKDSQGLCFIGQVDIKDFLKNFIEVRKGDVKNEQGEIVGKHDGAIYYTIGQRHGFTVTKKQSDDKPLFIMSKDVKENILVVSQRDPNTNNLLSVKSIILKDVNQISIPWHVGDKVLVRVRYRQVAQKAKLGWEGKNWKVIFDELQSVVAVGQSAVIYKGNDCLGGGVIDRVII